MLPHSLVQGSIRKGKASLRVMSILGALKLLFVCPLCCRWLPDRFGAILVET